MRLQYIRYGTLKKHIRIHSGEKPKAATSAATNLHKQVAWNSISSLTLEKGPLAAMSAATGVQSRVPWRHTIHPPL